MKIHDNDEWQPDLIFYIELYDPDSKDLDAYEEYDTKTKITIIDDDFPGTLGFEQTQISVKNNREYVGVNIERVDGSDGKISCVVRSMKSELSDAYAIENEHYTPINQRLEFLDSETKKNVRIPLINQEEKALKDFLINAGDFDWITGSDKPQGYVKFGDDGKLSTNIGGNEDDASWTLENMNTVTIKI